MGTKAGTGAAEPALAVQETVISRVCTVAAAWDKLCHRRQAAAQDVEKAVTGTQQVYRRNVFPEMNVQFGTYPNNGGHMDSPGCFRCHDDNHTTKDGKKIGQDCDSCHEIR